MTNPTKVHNAQQTGTSQCEEKCNAKIVVQKSDALVKYKSVKDPFPSHLHIGYVVLVNGLCRNRPGNIQISLLCGG